MNGFVCVVYLDTTYNNDSNLYYLFAPLGPSIDLSLRLLGSDGQTSANGDDLIAGVNGQINVNGTQYYNYSSGINNTFTKAKQYIILYVKFGNNLNSYNYQSPT